VTNAVGVCDDGDNDRGSDAGTAETDRQLEPHNCPKVRDTSQNWHALLLTGVRLSR
jgi:hypothetical protein